MSKTPITKVGEQLLREELQQLKHVERPSVINAISEARAQGDLSENAEYDAAKERQAFVEGRFIELEAKLSNHIILHKQLTEQFHHILFILPATIFVVN